MRHFPIFTALLYGAALPPAIAILVWVWYLKLEPTHLLDSVAFRLYYLLLFLLLLLELFRKVVARFLPGALLCGGILLVLLQGILWYGLRFSGMTAVGVEEQIVEYYASQAGAFISPPRIPQKVLNITSDPKHVTLVRDGSETRLEAGKAIERDGFIFRLQEVERAPLIAVQTAQGVPVDEAYLKQTATGEREDFIMFGRLPHRFYVKEIKNPENGSEMFRIKVVRAKLTIVDTTVEAGEGVYFDGHFVRCHPGALWARIAVEKRQSLLPLWSGLLLAAAGLIGSLVKKRVPSA